MHFARVWENELRTLGIVCHISSITRLLYWAWHGSDPYCHLQICPPPARSHAQIYTWTCTHIHAHIPICVHAHTHTHSRVDTNQYTWLAKNSSVAKTPNLDISHSIPRIPGILSTASYSHTQTSVLFSLPGLFSPTPLRGRGQPFIYWQVLQMVICLRQAKLTEIPNLSTQKMFMPLYLQIPRLR